MAAANRVAGPQERHIEMRTAETCTIPVWLLLAVGVLAFAQRRPGVIYSEAEVPAYTLPDPLTMADGTKVTDAETWRAKRRPEVLELFRKHVYGRAPAGPAIPDGSSAR